MQLSALSSEHDCSPVHTSLRLVRKATVYEQYHFVYTVIRKGVNVVHPSRGGYNLSCYLVKSLKVAFSYFY